MPTKSYAVEIPRINVESCNIQTRKHKAAAIGELLEENTRFVASLRSVDDIRNVRWCKEDRKQSSLAIEFRTAQQANKILDICVFIRGKHYNCEFADQQLRRCGKCQTFGHDQMSCSSAHRCGRCASQHATWLCKSNILHCANRHGPHQTSDVTCPAMKAYKQRLRYPVHSSPVGETELEEPLPGPQSRTAALSPPTSNPMPIIPHDEGEIKVEEEESLQIIGLVRENHDLSIPGNAQNEPPVRAEGSEPNHEMDLARKHPADLTLIQRHVEGLRAVVERLNNPWDFTLIERQLQDLRTVVERLNNPPNLTLIQRRVEDLRMVVERLSVPQHQHSAKRKRGADERLSGRRSSYARKQPKRATQGRYSYPVPNRSRVPAD